jgi:hypothetical protein
MTRPSWMDQVSTLSDFDEFIHPEADETEDEDNDDAE